MNEFAGHTIRVDKVTGYFNAKDMIKISTNKSKKVSHYLANEQTDDPILVILVPNRTPYKFKIKYNEACWRSTILLKNIFL